MLVDTFNIGYTSSRRGPSKAQKETLKEVIKDLFKIHRNYMFHNGCCAEGDEYGWRLVKQLKHKRDIKLVAHPPINKSLVFDYSDADETREEKEYLDRNNNIVAESNILIALPDTDNPMLRSGTWSTVRYAQKKPIPIILILPDGSKKVENLGKVKL